MVKAVRTSRSTPGPCPPRGLGPIGPKYLYGLAPIKITYLPSFGAIGPMTRKADLPLALGLAAGPLGGVLGLI